MSQYLKLQVNATKMSPKSFDSILEELMKLRLLPHQETKTKNN